MDVCLEARQPMQDPITPTIVPARRTCGARLYPRGSDLHCGQSVPHMPGYVPRCGPCEREGLSLGARLAVSLEGLAHYGDRLWWDLLAFNLAMGALLWAAACNAVHDYATPVLIVRPTREIDQAELERRLAACRDIPSRVMFVDGDA